MQPLIRYHICCFPAAVANAGDSGSSSLDFAARCSRGVSWRRREVWAPEEGIKGRGALCGRRLLWASLLDIFKWCKCILPNVLSGGKKEKEKEPRTYLMSSTSDQYGRHLNSRMFFFVFLFSDRHPQRLSAGCSHQWRNWTACCNKESVCSLLQITKTSWKAAWTRAFSFHVIRSIRRTERWRREKKNLLSELVVPFDSFCLCSVLQISDCLTTELTRHNLANIQTPSHHWVARTFWAISKSAAADFEKDRK